MSKPTILAALGVAFLLSACGNQTMVTKYPFYEYGQTPGEDPEHNRLLRDDEAAAVAVTQSKIKQAQIEDPAWGPLPRGSSTHSYRTQGHRRD